MIGGTRAVLADRIKTGRYRRGEFEHPIAYGEAEAMLTHAFGVIEKTRYEIEFQGAYWEIDVFAGAHRRLMTAEIEPANPDDEPSMSPLLGPEITGNPPHSNRGLVPKAGRPRLKLRKAG